MARGRRKAAAPAGADSPTSAGTRPIEQYDHKGKQRRNNPPVGLVTEATDRDAPKKRYAYDPHLDPALTWAGKAEHTSFEVPTVSLHVHERIDPKSGVGGGEDAQPAARYPGVRGLPVRSGGGQGHRRADPREDGQIESGDTGRIALWMLDPDYDGRSLFPRQVFFPLADEAGGWARLARNLKAEIDIERIEAYRGTVSLPFEPGEHRRVGVKIVDDRGIESLKIIPTP